MLDNSSSNNVTHLYHTPAQSGKFAIDLALAEDSTNHAWQPGETSADRTASKPDDQSQTENDMKRNPGLGSAENNIGLDERGKLKKWCLNCKKWISLCSSKASNYVFQEHFLSLKCKDRVQRIALEHNGGLILTNVRSQHEKPTKGSLVNGNKASHQWCR